MEEDSLHPGQVDVSIELLPGKKFGFEANIEASYSANSNTNNAKAVNMTADTATANTTAGNAPQLQNASVDEAVNAYLRLKNALTADNGNDAATAGKQLHEVMMILD
ncbi:MAG: DUF3347 domain-containing protein, partial [Cytophagaceae bacterium]